MNTILSKWTPEQVRARFVKAANTARRLLSDRPTGYASTWAALHSMTAGLGKRSGEDRKLRTLPAVIEEMLDARGSSGRTGNLPSYRM